MNEPNILLNVENLSVAFKTEDGYNNAVNNINLMLEKGKALGIVGESGSGKSITSLAIMGLLPNANLCKVQGKITFTHNGEKVNLLQLKDSEKNNYRGKIISMVFQEPMTSLNPTLKCGEQVEEVLRTHKHSSQNYRNKVLDLFNEVKLPDPVKAYNSYPFELSGGQRQRVMIAMAIACEPQLLIADEPTTALDVTVQKSILELLRELNKKNSMSMIFISHDLAVISEIADNVAVMYKGEMVEFGAVKNVLSNPQHNYTKALMACRPDPTERKKKLLVISDYTGNEAKKTEIVSGEERAKSHTKIYGEKPLIEVKNLSHQFVLSRNFWGKPQRTFQVLNNLSFSIYQGETLGLVGESGCGKTTLGRSLIRLIETANGEILYNGTDLRTLNSGALRKMRSKIQIIFQDPYSSLNPRLTVGQAIMEPMQVHGIGNSDKERKKIAIEMLTKVNLEEQHYYRYPHEFSGGQRQRIGIARALCLRPEFIICDESVSALDVSVQAQVLNLLNELKKDFNLTYLFISHDLSVVKFMSDRMIVMNKGCIEELGEADSVYNSPQSDYTQKLINSIPRLANNQ